VNGPQWRDTVLDAPDWRDDGRRVVMQAGPGLYVQGVLRVGDVGFDGEDEYPALWEVVVAGGPALSFFEFARYRFFHTRSGA
jgi:hypothetical protein